VKAPPLQERVRQRIRTLVDTHGVSHEILGKYLGLSRSMVTRLLNDESNGIGFPHLEKLCEFFQVTPCELMNSAHSLIQEVKPEEAQLLTHFRELTYTQKHGLLAVLEGRLAQPAKSRKARWGRAELTEEQQLVVDLFAQSEPEQRSAVLKVLRGTAKSAAAGRRAGTTESDP